jgi:hypothetical protein
MDGPSRRGRLPATGTRCARPPCRGVPKRRLSRTYLDQCEGSARRPTMQGRARGVDVLQSRCECRACALPPRLQVTSNDGNEILPLAATFLEAGTLQIVNVLVDEVDLLTCPNCGQVFAQQVAVPRTTRAVLASRIARRAARRPRASRHIAPGSGQRGSNDKHREARGRQRPAPLRCALSRPSVRQRTRLSNSRSTPSATSPALRTPN